MGRHRQYPIGQAPSDLKNYYTPRPKSVRALRIDAALGELCDLGLGRPLSQEAIATYCDVSKTAIQKIETRASRKMRRRLALLGISSSNLLPIYEH